MSGWSAGWARIHLDSVDSTNRYAVDRARTLDAPTWITATVQTAGYGRRRRVWHSAPGNLHASYVRPHPAILPPAPLYSYVAALAVHDCLVRLVAGYDQETTRDQAPHDRTPRNRIAIKWPNDILIERHKVAGILLEGVSTQAGPCLVIGIGINLVSSPNRLPDDSRLPAGDLLHMTGMTFTTDAVLSVLAETMMRREHEISALGFACTRNAWLQRALGPGQRVRAHTGHGTIAGRLETIDESGHAVLDCQGVRRTLVAADLELAQP
ncbi:MAG: biotin--[acetyl-CoA-carboxylase] ligase [Rhodobacteraceae bacterium]|nr:biotin--[acetyl-CoA-carboxylase] ligase [Paracoccaceae bacterium]